ncbi:MAG: hypothetical protein NTX50_22800 [Candidatus Sumerlaeota bacterium]|nr:hypothetical protein [Candidatus Sumerlaeota bacterium]
MSRKWPDICEKFKGMNPQQARSVAYLRFGDSKALCNTRSNERANGAIYLAGLCIECLLKAKLLEKHRWLQGGRKECLTRNEARLWQLCYARHDLEGLIAEMPELIKHLQEASLGKHGDLSQRLKDICDNWTIYARYSPVQTTSQEANDLYDIVKEIRTCLQ